uniref:Uncharacterized protein n=1 Tax=Glossina palpalis gambiensis TaxID=67801 RepID=A0A1B0BQX9_9MUSC
MTYFMRQLIGVPDFARNRAVENNGMVLGCWLNREVANAINYIYARLFLKLLTSHHTETKQPRYYIQHSTNALHDNGFIINKVIASLDSNASRVKKKKKNSLPELDFLQSTKLNFFYI